MQSQPGPFLAAPGRGLCLGKRIRSQASLEQEGTHSTVPLHRASPALPIPSSLAGPDCRKEQDGGSAEPCGQQEGWVRVTAHPRAAPWATLAPWAVMGLWDTGRSDLGMPNPAEGNCPRCHTHPTLGRKGSETETGRAVPALPGPLKLRPGLGGPWPRARAVPRAAEPRGSALPVPARAVRSPSQPGQGRTAAPAEFRCRGWKAKVGSC